MSDHRPWSQALWQSVDSRARLQLSAGTPPRPVGPQQAAPLIRNSSSLLRVRGASATKWSILFRVWHRLPARPTPRQALPSATASEGFHPLASLQHDLIKRTLVARVGLARAKTLGRAAILPPIPSGFDNEDWKPFDSTHEPLAVPHTAALAAATTATVTVQPWDERDGLGVYPCGTQASSVWKPCSSTCPAPCRSRNS